MARTSAIDTIIHELEAEIAEHQQAINNKIAFIARLKGPLVRRVKPIRRPRVLPGTENKAS